MNQRPRIYICHEPDEGGLAARLGDWPRTNDDSALYDARQRTPAGSPDGRAMQQLLARQIGEADVFVCLISQATGFDEWVTEEIALARAQPSPPGMVGIVLHEADIPPPAMVDAGAIFVPFQRDKVERAIEWAAGNRHKTRGDFKFIDE